MHDPDFAALIIDDRTKKIEVIRDPKEGEIVKPS